MINVFIKANSSLNDIEPLVRTVFFHLLPTGHFNEKFESKYLGIYLILKDVYYGDGTEILSAYRYNLKTKSENFLYEE